MRNHVFYSRRKVHTPCENEEDLCNKSTLYMKTISSGMLSCKVKVIDRSIDRHNCMIGASGPLPSPLSTVEFDLLASIRILCEIPYVQLG